MRRNFSMLNSIDTSIFFQNNNFFEKNYKSLGKLDLGKFVTCHPSDVSCVKPISIPILTVGSVQGCVTLTDTLIAA